MPACRTTNPRVTKLEANLAWIVLPVGKQHVFLDLGDGSIKLCCNGVILDRNNSVMLGLIKPYLQVWYSELQGYLDAENRFYP